MRFITPVSGTMIHVTDEKIAKGQNVIHCVIDAPEYYKLQINGTPCIYRGGYWYLSVPLSEEKTVLQAKSLLTGECIESTVWRIYTPKKIYRVSIDDGVWFLQDIARNQEKYRTIFDSPYLSLLKKLHEEYGTKFHINIYNEFPEHGGFELSEMTDRFKEEWMSVNDWLTLHFHAKADSPGYPYSIADRKTVFTDCKQVMDQVERFAGYRGAVTTLHFAETTEDGVRGLYDCGVRALLGDFSLSKSGHIQLCYQATKEEFEVVRKFGFWKNPKTDMIMFCCDTVLNSYAPSEIEQELDWFSYMYPERSFMDILIHEQYFYEDYHHYLPDYEQRLRTGIEWCIRHGFEAGLVKDVLGEQYLK